MLKCFSNLSPNLIYISWWTFCFLLLVLIYVLCLYPETSRTVSFLFYKISVQRFDIFFLLESNPNSDFEPLLVFKFWPKDASASIPEAPFSLHFLHPFTFTFSFYRLLKPPYRSHSHGNLNSSSTGAATQAVVTGRWSQADHGTAWQTRTEDQSRSMVHGPWLNHRVIDLDSPSPRCQSSESLEVTRTWLTAARRSIIS